jgi:isoaspartyl peptidase/L-asparaginase-like protein (Ntn-hydrolase superfamily)
MSDQNQSDIAHLLSDNTLLDKALREAVAQALQFHKKMGNPIAVWQNGQVVWLAPENIPENPQGIPEP